MAFCDSDCTPVFFMKCRVGLRNLNILFHVVSKIFFCVDWNACATSKEIYMLTNGKRF